MGRTVNRRGAATREALIDAAIDLWSASGWQVGSIAAVAERAGVTDAGLLHHFGTKENFVQQVLAELDRRSQADWDQDPPEGLDLIRALPEMARRSERRPGLWKLHLMFQAQNLDESSPAYDFYVQRHHYLHRRFADAIRLGQERGEIRPDADAELVAAQILAFLMGEGFHREHGPKDCDSVALCEDYAARLIRDLAVDAVEGL